jgi:hypothetical protein
MPRRQSVGMLELHGHGFSGNDYPSEKLNQPQPASDFCSSVVWVGIVGRPTDPVKSKVRKVVTPTASVLQTPVHRRESARRTGTRDGNLHHLSEIQKFAFPARPSRYKRRRHRCSRKRQRRHGCGQNIWHPAGPCDSRLCKKTGQSANRSTRPPPLSG